jgi:hypothetical protein
MVESVLGNDFKCIWTPGTPIFGGQDRIFSGLQTSPLVKVCKQLKQTPRKSPEPSMESLQKNHIF